MPSSQLALLEPIINVAKATVVPKKNMTSQARAAISQKYASIVGPMQIYLLYRKPILSQGPPTASGIYHCEANMLIFTLLKFWILSQAAHSAVYIGLKPYVLDYFGGQLSSQSQHCDRGPNRSTHVGRRRYKPGWHFSADQNLQ